MKNKKEKLKFIEKDKKGNYDIDGVSYDGEDVVVGSDKIDSSLSSNSKDLDSKVVQKNMKEKPQKVDRQKNMDAEEGTTSQS